jgi:hypothetical protein
MRSRICSSSLSGCQPTLSQLTETWELALHDIENDERKVSLTYLLGDNERIVTRDLDELVREAGSPNTLNNLILNVTQETPHREVLIQIGPGRRTLVTIEAEDHTWAIGRHTEVMEKLNKTHKWYALVSPARPVSWPEKRMNRSSALRNTLIALIAIPLGFAGAILLVAVATAYIAIVYEPTALIVQESKHHESIHPGNIILEFVSLAVICVTFYAATMSIMAGTSKVIIHREKFWSPNRLVLIGTLAGIVAAIASVLALLK